MTNENRIKTIAVVGTGVIGASWATYFLSRGFDVMGTDPGPGAEEKLRDYVNNAWPLLASRGLVTEASRERFSFTTDMQRAVSAADFVQENALEQAEFKAKLFAEMDEAAPPHSILASSSSSLTMDVIQATCKNPQRCIIGHPFNPPHIVPLVEVVGGAKTSEQTIERTMAFYTDIGKKAIRLHKALPGHVANRLQAALYKEVLFLLQQGVLNVQDVDHAVSYGPGLRWGVMGPNLQWHLGGGEGGIQHFIDHLMGSLGSLINSLSGPTIDDDLRRTVAAGVLEEAKGRTIAELSDQENKIMLDILDLRAKADL